MKNIFVTGGSGFVGAHLIRALNQIGMNVVSPSSSEFNLLEYQKMEGRFVNQGFDTIFHLAAWTQAGDFCLKYPGDQWLRNQYLNTNILRWWHEYYPQAKLVALGTSCSYPEGLPLSEENYLKDLPVDSLFSYAMTKRMLYAGLISLHRQFQMKYLHAVPNTLYGPGYHHGEKQFHFIFDLIRKILAGRDRGEKVALWGNGYQKRELVFIHDFVDALIYLAQHYENEHVNIGYGSEFTIRHFADLICEKTGYDSKLIQYDETRYTGAKSKCLDCKRILKLYPEYKRTDLSEGLDETIKWFEKNVH